MGLMGLQQRADQSIVRSAASGLLIGEFLKQRGGVIVSSGIEFPRACAAKSGEAG